METSLDKDRIMEEVNAHSDTDAIVYSVRGYYWIKDAENPNLSRAVRQTREYIARGLNHAERLAENDGLATGLLIPSEPFIVGIRT